MKYKLVINAFEGDGGASAAPAGTGEAGQPTTAAGENAGTTTQGSTESRKSFEEVFKEYGEEANQFFQKRWNERHRDYKSVKDVNKAQKPIIERLALKYGIEDANDLNSISRAMDNDDDLVMQRALNNGLTVDQQRNIDRVELENKRYREAKAEQEAQAQASRQFDAWVKEGENLKAIFPGFSLENELQNPEFRDALRKGIPVKRAYYSIHGDEIVSGAMEYTAQAVRRATEDEQASRPVRPRENGVNRQAAAKISTDVHSMTKAQRAEMAKRSMREKIYI